MKCTKLVVACAFATGVLSGVDKVWAAQDRTADVVKIVLDQKKYIQATGKDLVIFMSTSQVGKSTTINVLLNGALEYRETPDGMVVFEAPQTSLPKAKMGEPGGRSCTTLPSTYTKDGSPFVFLDTRGFFDSGRNTNGGIAASILNEMAVRDARSVRLVFLERYDTVKRGIVQFGRVGEVLGKIVKNNSVPVLFLFNGFYPEPCDGRAFYRKSPEEAARFIDQKLTVCIQQTVKAGEQEVADVRSGSDFQQFEEKMKYITFLKGAFQAKRYAHIDPVSQVSIDALWQTLQLLPVVSKEDLVFSSYNDDRIEFDRVFEGGLVPSVKTLQSARFARKYDKKGLMKFLDTQKALLSDHENALQYLAAMTARRAKDVSPEDDKQLAEYEAKYEIADDDIVQQKEELQQLLGSFNAQKHNLQKRIQKIEQMGPEKFWEDSWCNSGGIGFYRTHICLYDKGVPFVNIERNLGKYTHVCKTITEESPNFEESYGSGSFLQTLKNTGKGLVRGATGGATVAGEVGAVVGGAAGLMLDVAAAIGAVSNGESICDEPLFTKLFGIVGEGLAGILGGAGGALGGLVVGTLTSAEDCEGTVSIYVLPKNIPSNVEAIHGFKKEIANVDVQIAEAKERYARFRLDKGASLIDVVRMRKQFVEEQIRKIDLLKQFLERVDAEYQAQSRVISDQMDIISRLQMNVSGSRAGISEFVELFTGMNTTPRVTMFTDAILNEAYSRSLLLQ